MRIVLEIEVNTCDGAIEEMDLADWREKIWRAFPLALASEVLVTDMRREDEDAQGQ